ncbi:TolC family protein [Pseudoxanthomonas sangjuensis]|uniref:TolC family protein n=1 Tax=Pseudoxanthomonas sangjuensis TaxID=1503750 RepID=UPI001391BB25|nr:TolC family protein [Pseudoxanthomonas sangjuensis]
MANLRSAVPWIFLPLVLLTAQDMHAQEVVGAQARGDGIVAHSALGAFTEDPGDAARGIGVDALVREAAASASSRPPGYVASTPSGAELDWNEAVGIAVNRYPTVAAALATLGQQGEMVDVARAGYKPRVQAGVTSGGQGEYGNGQVATLGLSQMLYDFGKTSSAVARERAGVRREQAAVLQAIDDVVDKTAQALIEVHRYQALQRTSQALIDALRKVREITEMRAEAGAATRSDPIQARARMEAAQARALEVDAQLRQWRSRLQTYVGPAAARAVADAPAGMSDAAQEAGERDLWRVPAVLVAAAERDQAEAELDNARAQRYPTVSLEATANQRMGRAGNRYEQIYGKSSYGAAFISVGGALYQGGAAAARSRASAGALAAAEARLDAERLAASDNLRFHRERMDGLNGRIVVLEQRLQSIAETRELYWDQYLSLGTRNVLDLLNAEQEIGQAQEDLANARHDLWNAQLGYLVAAGRARAAFGLDNSRVQGMEILP